MIYTLEQLVLNPDRVQTCINGKWVPARPLPAFFRHRLQAAWAVLTGKADAFTWPEGQ